MAGMRKTDVIDFYRLFLVPGMGHCQGGIGTNDFGNNFVSPLPDAGCPLPDAEHDLLSALDAWVERRTAPAKIIGTGTALNDPTKTLTRPLCPYPQVAHYRGSGDPNDAVNFTCAVPNSSR
jgi:feruloyl esterase